MPMPTWPTRIVIRAEFEDGSIQERALVPNKSLTCDGVTISEDRKWQECRDGRIITYTTYEITWTEMEVQ